MTRPIAAFLVVAAAVLAGALPVLAQAVAPREGWVVIATPQPYPALLTALKEAVAAEGMAVVTEAGPTEAAKARGIAIPGNRVVGVYRNDYAVRALGASAAAMIEAPIRFYVTERPDGGATLSYKTPSFVFAPYRDEGGPALRALAAELDDIFRAIADRASARVP